MNKQKSLKPHKLKTSYLFSAGLALGIQATQAQEAPSFKFQAGGHTAFQALLGSGADRFGFDMTYMYAGAQAQFNDYWGLNLRFDNDAIFTPTEDTTSTRNLPYLRAFFIESKNAVAEGFRFRFGRHSTIYTEMVEKEIPLRWLGNSLNRSTNFLYKTVDGVSFLFDYKIIQLALQTHNGAEGLSYTAPLDDSLGMNFYFGFSPFAGDESSKARNFKLHASFALDTTATVTDSSPSLISNSRAVDGYAAWMLGLSYRDTPIDLSFEYGRSKTGQNGTVLGAWALMADLKFGQTGASLFTRLGGYSRDAQSADRPKFEITLGPTFTLSKAAKTALLVNYARVGAATSTQTNKFVVSWNWSAAF